MSLTLASERKGIEKYREYLGPRYATFADAFEAFMAVGGKTIVELGTTRSFVSGGRPGCMVNDRRFWNPTDPSGWDWGAGMFTRMCAEHLEDHFPEIHSVDISAAAIEIARVITAALKTPVIYHHTSSEHFLQTFRGKIDLLYMDAGETEAEADKLHLREATIVLARQLLTSRAVVLIDDVHVPGTTSSKGRLSIPFFLERGFQIRSSDYQVVLQRNS